MPMKHEPGRLRKAILAFRENHRDRYGLGDASTPTGLGQMFGLSEARMQALALLLEAEPAEIISLLDKLVWQADLSEHSLSAARAEAGLPNPVWSCLNSDKKAYMSTLTDLLEADEAAPNRGGKTSGMKVLGPMDPMSQADEDTGKVARILGEGSP